MSKEKSSDRPNKPPKTLIFELDYPVQRQGKETSRVKMGRFTLEQMLHGQKYSDDEFEQTLYSISVCTENADEPWTIDELKQLDPSDALVLIKEWTVFTQGRAKTLEQNA